MILQNITAEIKVVFEYCRGFLAFFEISKQRVLVCRFPA